MSSIIYTGIRLNNAEYKSYFQNIKIMTRETLEKIKTTFNNKEKNQYTQRDSEYDYKLMEI